MILYPYLFLLGEMTRSGIMYKSVSLNGAGITLWKVVANFIDENGLSF